jgi:hypothetical protein
MLNIEKELKRFGDIVIKNARKQLKRKNDTSKLYNSLDYNIKVNKAQAKGIPPSFEFDFVWLDYGKFIDEGVRGAGGVRKTTSKFKSTNNKGKLWKIYAKKSRFSYKDIKPSVNHFRGWASRKGISPYAVREAVYHQGIKTTHFFSRPFEQAYKYLPDTIAEAYGDDLEIFLKKAL